MLRIERGLCGKVEAGEIAHEWETRELRGHLDAPLVFAGDLALAEQYQRLAQAQLLSAGLFQQTVKLMANAGEL